MAVTRKQPPRFPVAVPTAVPEIAVQAANEIRARIGPLDDVEVFHNMVLVATYIRPEKTAGGIIRPEKTRDEDKWQGKAGLVLKVGSIAFVDDATTKFNGVRVHAGDWVVFNVNDGFAMDFNKVRCRLLQDVHIKMRVLNPDEVW